MPSKTCEVSFRRNALQMWSLWQKIQAQWKLYISCTNCKLLSCNVCQMKFVTKIRLSIHYKSHPEYRPFSCPKCPQCFQHQQSLRQHFVIHTDDSKLYQCDTCLKSFKRQQSMKSHLKTHSDIRNFVCKICQKRFKCG